MKLISQTSFTWCLWSWLLESLRYACIFGTNDLFSFTVQLSWVDFTQFYQRNYNLGMSWTDCEYSYGQTENTWNSPPAWGGVAAVTDSRQTPEIQSQPARRLAGEFGPNASCGVCSRRPEGGAKWLWRGAEVVAPPVLL